MNNSFSSGDDRAWQRQMATLPLVASHVMASACATCMLKCAPGQVQVLAAQPPNQIPCLSQKGREFLTSLNKVLKLTRVAFVD